MQVRNVVLGVGNMDRGVRFWCELLDLRPDECSAGPRWTRLVPRVGDGPALGLQVSTAEAQDFPRVHVDFAVHGRTELERVADRVVALGGERVPWPLYPLDPDFVVLADTEGNRFCLVDVEHRPAGES